MAKFIITSSKGFQIEFDNGFVVSVQFGGGNYCDNYDIDIGSERKEDYFACPDAEVAIFKQNRRGWFTKKLIKKATSDVVGHITPDELPKILSKVAKL